VRDQIRTFVERMPEALKSEARNPISEDHERLTT